MLRNLSKMAPKKFTFRGLMAPVFTAYKKDGSVDLDIIAPYAKHLASSGIKGILVNGTTGEGPSLSLDERKRTAAKWHVEGRKLGLSVMIQIGGAPYPNVIELAKHAAELDVDSVLCLPELYFKPSTEEALADYLLDVSRYCPTIPILYYHIPMFTQLSLDMPRFCDVAKARIPSFVGIKYTSGDLAGIAPCAGRKDLSFFIGSDTILMGALALGFDSSIATTLNFYPEKALEIVAFMEKSDLAGARKVQLELNEKVAKILKEGGGDWVTSTKKAFNEIIPSLNVGKPRKPL